MKRLFSYILLAGFLTPAFLLVAPSRAEAKSKKPKVLQVQTETQAAPASPSTELPAEAPKSDLTLVAPVAIVQMSPEVALEMYERRAAWQGAFLASYSANTVIEAELPDQSQKGRYELQRTYSAPHTLKFKAVSFTGDGFVKTNVIHRLMQSEVDHVEKQEGPETAITTRNYKFNYKGVKEIDGHQVHVFDVKPREKRVGLFRGRIYIDMLTGTLRRAEGQAIKSPSFFVNKIEFTTDYADFGIFTFPIHLHSSAKTRLVGRAVVDVSISDYQAQGVSVESAGPAIPVPVPGVH
ncbi:MAG: hypothetical protein M3O85_02835 [Acidobacteriota bacterium]|nr:hypothetical protein [Acidobacteriota bacterium]